MSKNISGQDKKNWTAPKQFGPSQKSFGLTEGQEIILICLTSSALFLFPNASLNANHDTSCQMPSFVFDNKFRAQIFIFFKPCLQFRDMPSHLIKDPRSSLKNPRIAIISAYDFQDYRNLNPPYLKNEIKLTPIPKC